MERSVLLQAGQFLWSVGLGAALGLCYDLLRGLRRSLRVLTGLLDLVFCMLVLLSGLWSALYICGGQYRIFMFLGTSAGAALWFLTIGRLFLRLSCGFWSILILPLRLCGKFFGNFFKKLRIFLKNLFSRRKKSVKISKHHSRGGTEECV